jgi:hypothetical protein
VQSNRTLRRYYCAINRKFFNNELPDNVCVRYADDEDFDEGKPCAEILYGWCDKGDGRHVYQIAISKFKCPGSTAIVATLLHEMCHVYLQLRDDHGPAFERCRQMIADRGAFKKNAILPGLTIF